LFIQEETVRLAEVLLPALRTHLLELLEDGFVDRARLSASSEDLVRTRQRTLEYYRSHKPEII
jgi:hypothetical protein